MQNVTLNFGMGLCPLCTPKPDHDVSRDSCRACLGRGIIVVALLADSQVVFVQEFVSKPAATERTQ